MLDTGTRGDPGDSCIDDPNRSEEVTIRTDLYRGGTGGDNRSHVRRVPKLLFGWDDSYSETMTRNDGNIDRVWVCVVHPWILHRVGRVVSVMIVFVHDGPSRSQQRSNDVSSESGTRDESHDS